jgi:hypothetical protein
MATGAGFYYRENKYQRAEEGWIEAIVCDERGRSLQAASASLKITKWTTPRYQPCEPPEPAVVDAATRMLQVCNEEMGLGLEICWFRIAVVTYTSFKTRPNRMQVRSMIEDKVGLVTEYSEALAEHDPEWHGLLEGKTIPRYPGLIFVNAMRTPYRTAMIVAHEARHQRQLADDFDFGSGLRGHVCVPAERDARAYAAAKRALARQIVKGAA